MQKIKEINYLSDIKAISTQQAWRRQILQLISVPVIMTIYAPNACGIDGKTDNQYKISHVFSPDCIKR